MNLDELKEIENKWKQKLSAAQVGCYSYAEIDAKQVLALIAETMKLKDSVQRYKEMYEQEKYTRIDR